MLVFQRLYSYLTVLENGEIMVDADHLRIVFHVNGVGFVMPVADLLAIRGKGEDELTAVESPDSPLQTGFIVCRETDVSVYTLA